MTKPAPTPSRTSLVAATALVALVALVASATACGKTCEEQGGVVVNGFCEGKCEPSKCLEGNVCSGNRCVLVCTSQADCAEGQSCAPAKADDGSDILACTYASGTQRLDRAPTLDACDDEDPDADCLE
ncbi:MAG: hypothetical protein U0414_20690 [Polyangiaceae bacterium]